MSLQGDITRFKAYSIAAMETSVLLLTRATIRDWTPSRDARDRRAPYKKCFEEMSGMNLFEKDW